MGLGSGQEICQQEGFGDAEPTGWLLGRLPERGQRVQGL